MISIAVRYDLRIPPFASTTHAEQYAACLEQCAFADERGFDVVVLSEHHGVEDGFLPAPVTMAAAVAGRTRKIGITIAAILVPLHDPVRLAEQLAVAQLASGNRVSFVAGLGYRAEELEMACVDPKSRGRLLEEYVGVMRSAWSGEPFEWRGRTICVTPKPEVPPMILIGGSTPIAARRAARLRGGFFPSIGDAALAEAYKAECARVGFDGGFVMLPSGPGFVHVSRDPERDWQRILPHALYDARTYSSWQTPEQRSQMHVHGDDAQALRQSGVYRVVTPDECVALVREHQRIVLHPLMGGLPPEMGWQGLRLFADEVLPKIRGSS
jgi:alkanesulfonate monooxygenase SsuD/methylene tetrahydromethanopterin reductase-like flavin-dependent oxidoreductase (luciferase family)